MLLYLVPIFYILRQEITGIYFHTIKKFIGQYTRFKLISIFTEVINTKIDEIL